MICTTITTKIPQLIQHNLQLKINTNILVAKDIITMVTDIIATYATIIDINSASYIGNKYFYNSHSQPTHVHMFTYSVNKMCLYRLCNQPWATKKNKRYVFTSTKWYYIYTVSCILFRYIKHHLTNKSLGKSILTIISSSINKFLVFFLYKSLNCKILSN